MDPKLAKGFLIRWIQRVKKCQHDSTKQVEESESVSEKMGNTLDLLEKGPGPRTMAPDGNPVPNQIVCRKADGQKGHPANLAYRRKIKRMANDYQERSDTLLVEELGQEDGSKFILKADSIRKEMEVGRYNGM